MSSGIYTRPFCFLSNWNSSVFLRQLSKVTPPKQLRLAPSQQGARSSSLNLEPNVLFSKARLGCWRSVLVCRSCDVY